MVNQLLITTRRFILLTVFAVSLGSCSESDDYELFSSIQGYVYDSATGTPLENANITITPGGMSTLTAVDGTFAFDELDARQYTILVQKNEYQPNRKVINIISGEENKVSIPLSKIPAQ